MQVAANTHVSGFLQALACPAHSAAVELISRKCADLSLFRLCLLSTCHERYTAVMRYDNLTQIL